ncbi:hypothetical protein [Persicobacter psychrovividus]|uniref:Sulfatase N-terminal domain-containing protein n=1 Tax=Persicobacter psychrovividus TaxID=387638 RepID=A0ABM7VFV8_9BACT|nr:hypothetical protein PEPS_21310 [Persicobacter psychrovividus]
MRHNITHSFTFQLLKLSLRNHPLLLAFWIPVLYLIFQPATSNISFVLEPEFMGKVDFISFLLTGLTLGIFTFAYHLSLFIFSSPRLPQLYHQKSPLRLFILNNSLLPVLCLLLYTFLSALHLWRVSHAVAVVFGLPVGFLLSQWLWLSLIESITINPLHQLIRKLNHHMQHFAPWRKKLLKFRQQQRHPLRVERMIGSSVKNSFKSRPKLSANWLMLFNQYHLNLLMIAITLLAAVQIFAHYPSDSALHLPAMATLFIILAMLLLLMTALSYWLRRASWVVLLGLVIISGFNREENIKSVPALPLKTISRQTNLQENSLPLFLKNWRARYTDNPHLILIYAEGHGQRAALWSFEVMRQLEQAMPRHFRESSPIYFGQGSSLVGLTYFRELSLRKAKGYPIDLTSEAYRQDLSREIFNSTFLNLFSFQAFSAFIKSNEQYFSTVYETKLDEYTRGLLRRKVQSEPLNPMFQSAPLLWINGQQTFLSAEKQPNHHSLIHLLSQQINKTPERNSLALFLSTHQQWLSKNTMGITIVHLAEQPQKIKLPAFHDQLSAEEICFSRTDQQPDHQAPSLLSWSLSIDQKNTILHNMRKERNQRGLQIVKDKTAYNNRLLKLTQIIPQNELINP